MSLSKNDSAALWRAVETRTLGASRPYQYIVDGLLIRL